MAVIRRERARAAAMTLSDSPGSTAAASFFAVSTRRYAKLSESTGTGITSIFDTALLGLAVVGRGGLDFKCALSPCVIRGEVLVGDENRKGDWDAISNLW